MPASSKFVRHCPHCFDSTGDTFVFDAPPPVGAACDECGSRLLPLDPSPYEAEGWLEPRDYSEPYEPEYAES